MDNISGANDFDFLLSKWNIVNRRKKINSLLTDPEQNKDAIWEEFPATGGRAVKHLDGRVMIDFFDGTFPGGRVVKGITIRAFDPTTGEWSIGWLDNRQSPDFRPLIGKFVDGVGEFNQVISTADGEPLHVRFRWDNMSENSARWQQAFSMDSGGTWEVNWIMEFSKDG